MNTYLVTWNPDNWPWETLADDALQTANGNSVSGRWSCGNTKRIEEGDRLFLLKQGPKSPRGFFASGRATSGVYQDKHWRQASAGKKARYVDADWDAILNIDTESLLQVSKIDEGHDPQVNWKTQSSGIAIPLPVARRIEALWSRHVADVRGNNKAKALSPEDELASIESALSDEGYFDALDPKDERHRQRREIVQRRGQPEFRRKLLVAYGGRCAVTGCDVADALEAAHIMPYKGAKSHHVTNGVLLRADIHTLFDLNLIGIDPHSMKIVLSQQVQQSSYAETDGSCIHEPEAESQRINNQALRARWKLFRGNAK
jgi:hypothetical protein